MYSIVYPIKYVHGFAMLLSGLLVTAGLASPDSKVHGANMGPIWGRQDPGGPHVGPMNFVIWDCFGKICCVKHVENTTMI